MSIAQPRRVYHVLLAWPEPHNTALWRALRALAPLISVNYAHSATLAAHLGATDYYHILHLSPLQWRAFPPAEQQRIAVRIPLIILGPEATLAEDLVCARAGLYFPETQPIEVAVNVVCEFHARLVEGYTLGSALAATQGCLALVGNARCMDTDTAPTPGPPSKATTASAPAVPAASVAGGNSGIAIGRINVGGDAVMGNKYVQQASGDQVNISRIGDAAGGNLEGAMRNSCPASYNTEPQRVCRDCGNVVESAVYRFCQRCGTELEDMGNT